MKPREFYLFYENGGTFTSGETYVEIKTEDDHRHRSGAIHTIEKSTYDAYLKERVMLAIMCGPLNELEKRLDKVFEGDK